MAANNDHHLPLNETPVANAGKEKAEAACAAMGARVLLVPEVSSPAAARKGTNCNDCEAQLGHAAAEAVLRAQLAEAKIPRSVEAQHVILRQSASP